MQTQSKHAKQSDIFQTKESLTFATLEGRHNGWPDAMKYSDVTAKVYKNGVIFRNQESALPEKRTDPTMGRRVLEASS